MCPRIEEVEWWVGVKNASGGLLSLVCRFAVRSRSRSRSEFAKSGTAHVRACVCTHGMLVLVPGLYLVLRTLVLTYSTGTYKPPEVSKNKYDKP